MRKVFKEPLIVAFRMDKYLYHTLVHSKTNAALKSANFTCKTGCGNCRLLSREAVRDSFNQLTFKPVQNVTCRDRNMVHLLCARCQATVCDGELGRELR